MPARGYSSTPTDKQAKRKAAPAPKKSYLQAIADNDVRANGTRKGSKDKPDAKPKGRTLQQTGEANARARERYRENASPAEYKATRRRYLESARGESSTVAREAEKTIQALARDWRATTGLHNAPRDPVSVRKQAAAQIKGERVDAKNEAARAVGYEIQANATEQTEDAYKQAAEKMKRAGVPNSVITDALNGLKKEPESFALRALQQLSRPVSGVAGAVRATYKGENPHVAFARGVIKNDQSFSRVLEDAGAPEWAQTWGGLTLDIALDPTTYLTLGASAPANVAAKGALVAAKRAGASADEALAVARKVYDAHPHKGRGVQVGLRGTPVRAASTLKNAAKTGSLKQGRAASTREVKTSGATTSKLVGSPVKALADEIRGMNPGKTAKADRAGTELVNSYKPRGIHPMDFEHARAAARHYRAARGAGERLAAARVKGYQQFVKKNAIKAGGLDRIAVALDAGTLGTLKGAERELADILKRDLASIAAREVDAGVRTTDAVRDAYWPRVLRAIAGADAPTGAGSAGRRVTGTSFKARTDTRPIADMAPEEAARYLTDDLGPIARRLGDSGRALALSKLHTEVAALGPVVKSLDDIEAVGGNLATTYARDGQGFKRLWKEGEAHDATLAKIEAAIKSGTEVRAISEQTHELAFKQALRGKSGLDTDDALLARGFDKTQGTLKLLQTIPNPGYHVTNLLGDLFNARVGGATFNELKGAARQVRLERKMDAFDGDVMKSIGDLDQRKLAAGGKTETYGANGKLADAEVVDLAREHGAIQTGFAGSELHALTKSKATKAYRLDQRFMEGARHANELREDVVRLVSFRSALKRGDSPAEAAAHVARYHFDYADLTESERKFARRVIPFYTFFRRNVPTQARGLVGSPGRYATVEKTRDAMADEAGLGDGWDAGLPTYMQKQTPFAIPGLSAAGLPIAANLKLPLSDLNALDPRGFPDELAQRMSVLLKLPVELYSGYDFYFRDTQPKALVPAPSWAMQPEMKAMIENLPGSPKVKMIQDRKTGKMVPGWSWKLDKLLRVLPIGGAIQNATTPGKSRHAKGKLAVAGYLAGPRPFTLDPADFKTQRLFAQLGELEDEQAALKQTVRHRSGEKWGGQIAKLGKEIGELQAEIAKLDATAGYDSPRFKAKRKAKSNYFGGSIGYGSIGTGYGD